MAGFGDLLKAGASAVGSSISSQGGMGSGFIGGALSKVGEGSGIGEALKGSAGDVFKGVKESFSPRNIAQKAGNQFFSGGDIFSTFGRAVVNKQFGEKGTSSPTQMSSGGTSGYGGGGGTTSGGAVKVGGAGGGGGVAFGGASFVALCAKSCRCGGTSGPSSASKAEISSALGALSLFSPLAEGVFFALFFAAVFFTGASLGLSATGVALG